MAKTLAEIQASIESKLEEDTDFQSSLVGLSEGDKMTRVNERKQSEIDAEISRLDSDAEGRKKAEEIAKNQKIRAEKAEGDLKKGKEADSSGQGEKTLTPKDTIALINAKIQTEDFDSVVEWSKFKGVSVSDALKDKTLQVVLREKDEERKTANATATRGGKGFSKEKSEDIVARASRGEVPEDDEGILRLAEAQYELKMRKIQR